MLKIVQALAGVPSQQLPVSLNLFINHILLVNYPKNLHSSLPIYEEIHGRI